MSDQKKPEPAIGLSRVWKAFFYSVAGIRQAWRDEAAFRQELGLVVVLSVVCISLSLTAELKIAILICHVLVLIAELINTAVEAVVDMVSPGFHLQAKKAKDTASAAVLLALLLTAGIWVYAIFTLIR